MRVAVRQKLKRWPRLGIVALLIFAMVLPLLNNRAGAFSLPSQRSIKMSSSATGAIADGQDVTYELSFITNQNGANSDIGSLVLEFCSNTPIIGDSCTPPAGFSTHAYLGDNTLALGAQLGTGGADFAISTTNATANRIILTRTVTPQITSGTGITIPFGTSAAGDGITNPTTTNTTFYARVITFTTTTGAQEYDSQDIENTDNTPDLDSGTPNVAVDAGGFALSTAAQITITAKVPEKLTFCVFTTDGSVANTCGTGSGSTAPSGTAVTLGDTNGVLSDIGAYVDKNAKYSVATNALYNVAIRVKGGTLKTSAGCPETPGQNCSIDATGGGTGAVSAPGTEQFGFCTYRDTATATGLTPAEPYDDTNCAGTTQTAGTGSTGGDNGATFGFDNDIVGNPTDATTSTYGQTIATKTAGTFSTGVLVFLGNITTTTEPGIYTTTLMFIATGTY